MNNFTTLNVEMQPDVDCATLRCAECGYREALATDPSDMSLRVNLAWCLFMQASHLPVYDSTQADRDAADLLRDCMRQIMIVTQLSTNDRDRIEMERLRVSVKTAFGTGVVAQADDMGTRVLAKLTHAILETVDSSLNAGTKAVRSSRLAGPGRNGSARRQSLHRLAR